MLTPPEGRAVLRPDNGTRATLQPEVASRTAGVAGTYATDVFTITNGGYGGRLRDAPQTGATTWLMHPTAVIDLPAERHPPGR